MDNYGEFLRLLTMALETRGRNQAWLAKEVGMSDSWVSRVLSGDIDISVKQLFEIAERLSVPPALLLPIIFVDESKKERIMNLEDFVREVARQEIEKAKK